MVTNHILQRVFNIFYGGRSGTCFTIDVDGRQYIVTACHLVRDIPGNGSVHAVQIAANNTCKEVHVKAVGHLITQDISVLAAQNWHSPTHPLSVTMDGVRLSEEVFFLGYPYGISSGGEHLNNGFPMPFVKKAILSSPANNQGLFCLDGHNNIGFSGGPVVRMEGGTNTFVIGVVSGYRYEEKKVYGADSKTTDNKIKENTGIVYAYPSDLALTLIKNNPIGLQVPTIAAPHPPRTMLIHYKAPDVSILTPAHKK